MRADAWWKCTGALVSGIVFMVVGIRVPKITARFRTGSATPKNSIYPRITYIAIVVIVLLAGIGTEIYRHWYRGKKLTVVPALVASARQNGKGQTEGTDIAPSVNTPARKTVHPIATHRRAWGSTRSSTTPKPAATLPQTPETASAEVPPSFDRLNMSDTRASLIGDDLKNDPPKGSVRIVSIGDAHPDLVEQLRAQFRVGGWEVHSTNIGSVSMAGFHPTESLYILSPHPDGQLVISALHALGAAHITAPIHPELPTIGPLSQGISDVTIVVQR